jgi:hypothetical protein
MTINELKTQYPALYSRIFNLGVHPERKRALAADLIAGAVESQPPQINSPAMVVERSRAFQEGVARAMKLRVRRANAPAAADGGPDFSGTGIFGTTATAHQETLSLMPVAVIATFPRSQAVHILPTQPFAVRQGEP